MRPTDPSGPLSGSTSPCRSTEPPPPRVLSIEHVCEANFYASPGADLSAPPDLLLEVPHGATQRSHYETIRRSLRGELPEDLVDFFFVNTDVGSSEVAQRIAELVTEPASAAHRPRSAFVLRCLIPRTFIDTNRVAEVDDTKRVFETDAEGPFAAELSPAIPEYVRSRDDAESLLELYARYQAVAQQAYELVCGSGGLALTPHTYAPKAISVESFDEGIGKALRQAYQPDRYEQWDTRPAVDIVTAGSDGVSLAPPRLVEAIKSNYTDIGIQATENVSYSLHPSTMGHVYSSRYPHQVLCFEISRDLLAEPFAPFEEMRIAEHKVARMSAPIAAAVLDELEEPTGRCC